MKPAVEKKTTPFYESMEKMTRKLLPLLIALIIPAMAFVTVAAQGFNHQTIVDPEPLASPIMVQDESAPAMISISALYAPAENKDDWIRMVCTGMTAGGCDYFKSHQADSLWESQAGHDASSGGFIESVADINETSQVWHVVVTVFARDSEVTSDVYVLVERGAGNRWHLNRVLYGPGIQQQ